MLRLTRWLTALLGFALLAANSASAVAAFSGQNPASGSLGSLEHRLGQNSLASADRLSEKLASLYDFASDFPVAARGGARYVDEVIAGAYGQSSVGAGQVLRTLQTGGNKILKRTADALNDALGQSAGRRDWGRALEGMKRDLGLPGDHHGKILSNGQYVDDSGNVLGSLLDYLP